VQVTHHPLPRSGLPAEFAEPVVVNAEVVGDLVDDGPPDLEGDLLLGAADRADLDDLHARA
jgi:hypothetical protein